MKGSLKARLQAAPAVLAPGVFDALTALLVEQAGFEAVYLSGASVAYTQIGRPDIGLVSLDHVVDVASRITERVGVPLIVDADTGFGNALNVQRTVRLLERAGASAIQLEDQSLPKRCGHLSGKSLIAAEEMVGKLHAATDARLSPETLIIARTDAVAVEGYDNAIERAERYVEAGADILFIEAPRSLDQLRSAAETFAHRLPMLANMVEGGDTPLQSLDDLSGIGYRLVISPGALVRAIIPLAEEFLGSLRANGSSMAFRSRMTDLVGVNQRIGLDHMLSAGKKYGA